jgi:hypothetical protein
MKLKDLVGCGLASLTSQVSPRSWGGDKLDLHTYCLEMAKKAIGEFVRYLREGRADNILLIHGYHHGTVLKDYIRGGNLEEYLRTIYPDIERVGIHPSGAGTTCLRLFWKKGSGCD